MNDSFTRVYSAIQGIIQQVTAHLAPAIAGISKQFTDFVGSVGGANIGQAIGEALLDGADYLAQVGDYIIANFGPTLSGVVQYLSQAAGQWSVSFSLGERVANLFISAFKFLQFVGNLLSTSISFLLQKMLQTAADIADYIPGFGSVADANRQAAAAMGDVYQRSLAEADKNFAAAGEAFNKSLSSGTASTGQAIAEGAIGPLQGFVRQARDVARAAAAGQDKAAVGLGGQQKQSVAAVVRISSADLNAIVSGTSGAESFRNALARGADPRLETKEDTRRTADASERTAEAVEELARTGMLGVATLA
jgi:phage-related protein